MQAVWTLDKNMELTDVRKSMSDSSICTIRVLVRPDNVEYAAKPGKRLLLQLNRLTEPSEDVQPSFYRQRTSTDDSRSSRCKRSYNENILTLPDSIIMSPDISGVATNNAGQFFGLPMRVQSATLRIVHFSLDCDDLTSEDCSHGELASGAFIRRIFHRPRHQRHCLDLTHKLTLQQLLSPMETEDSSIPLRRAVSLGNKMEISESQSAVAITPQQSSGFPQVTSTKQPSSNSSGRALVSVRESWNGGGSKLRRVARVAMGLNLKAVNWVLKRYLQLQSDSEFAQQNSSTGFGPALYWPQKND
uniref:Uncharacterized protein n=1 Tax=Schistocephalus solidus TaxID=70667 RepID=A0A0X3P8W7_SCHSO